jgi:hypothetical protein
MTHRLLPFLLPLALAACSDLPTAPVLRGLEAATDRASYTQDETISLTVVNASNDDAFFHHCGYRISFVLEQSTSQGWVTVAQHAGPICPAIYAAGVKVLTPGSAYVTDVPVEHAGTFRVRLDTGVRSQAIGSVRVVSNTFTVN